MTAHLREAWHHRIEGAAGYIYRGLFVEDLSDLAVARKMEAGTATARDILGLLDLDPVGIWWLREEDDGEEEAREYAIGGAGSEELVAKWLPEYEPGYPLGQVEVVLVARHPVINGVSWNPEDNPLQMGGLMGSWFMPTDTPLDLVEVQYNAGWGWKVLPAHGVRVTT